MGARLVVRLVVTGAGLVAVVGLVVAVAGRWSLVQEWQLLLQGRVASAERWLLLQESVAVVGKKLLVQEVGYQCRKVVCCAVSEGIRLDFQNYS